MKTISVGLIPVSTLRLKLNLLCLVLAGILTGISQTANSMPDEYPGMSFFSLDGLTSAFGAPAMLGTQAAMSCRPLVQVSLNQEGYAVIVPGMLVKAPTYPLDQYEVDIMGPLTDTVFCDQIGQEIMVVVEELPTGNTCMSELTVEDKLPPFISCSDDTVACNVVIQDLDFLSFVDSVADNCSDPVSLWYSYTINEFECDPGGMAGRIDLTVTATDDFGNASTCMQSIWLEKFTLDEVEFPADTVLSCTDPDTSIQNVGQPMIGGTPIHHFCELVAWRMQSVIPLCSGEFKVARVWSVMDWCTGQTITQMQTILVVDTIPPVIDCPENDTLGTDPGVCYATYEFPDVEVTDVCSDDDLIQKYFTVSTVPGLFYAGETVELGLGDHVITISATDDCFGNSTCQYTITVIDDEVPVLVCHNYSTNLNDMGMSFLQAESAQFFASDNCEIDSIAVRRMFDNCDNPQDTVFGPFVKFCCNDAEDTVMVIFQAIDASGNEQQCMIEVYVKDVTPPDAQCYDSLCVFLDDFGMAMITADDIDSASTDNCEIVERTIDKEMFTCADLHESVNPHTVTLTLTDPSGNMSTCQTIVTVKDTIPPTPVCKDITIMLDENGFASIEPGDVDSASFDNCLIVEREVIPNEFGCDDVGELNIVTLIVTDQSGNVDSCEAMVEVFDNPPVVECMDATLCLDDMGLVVVQQSDIDAVMDDCGIDEVVIEPDSLFCDNVGENSVALIVTDVFGNVASCEVTVTVEDCTPPECVAMDITVELDENGMYTLAPDEVDNGSSDVCGIESIVVNPDEFDCDDAGSVIVVVQTVTDVNGNTSTCTANVTVEDNTLPECITQDITVYLDENGEVMIDGDGVDDGSLDNCEIESITVDPNDFDCDQAGDGIIVTQTVTDENGNVSTCTATVTVLDTIAPICVTQDITIYLDEDGMASIGETDVDDGSSDNCEIESITVDPDDFDCDDVGIVTVTQTVTDVNGNVSTCEADVTVIDSIAPECLTMDITVMLDEDGMVSIPDDGVDNGSNDECGLESITTSQTEFDCDDADMVIVVVQTVTDQNGNTSTCTANVTVEDNLDPECVTQDITVYLDENGQAMIDNDGVDDGSSDNCGDVTITVDPSDFDCDQAGSDIVVTQTVTDQNGNISTCTATVTVLDTIAPLCETQDITVFLDENGMVSIAEDDVDDGSTDNCEVMSITVDPDDFDCDDVGVVTVVQTVTDVNGNVSTCEAEVTVVDDLEPICVAMDITVSLDENGEASIDSNGVDDGSSDNCAIESIEVSQTDFDCTDVPSVVVTQTVTDVNGNTSTCTATVTIENMEGPMAVCQDITVFLDEEGMVSITAEDVDGGSSVNCGDLGLEIDIDEFDCDDIGPNTVILTVADESEQTDTCHATVTVLDSIAPTCVAQDVTVYLDDMGMASVSVDDIDDGSSDNCDVMLSIDPSDFDCNDTGVNTVTLTATDPSGNVSECDATVTVLDTIAPICQAVEPFVIVLPGSGMVSIDADDIDDGSSDNCPLLTLEVEPTMFDCDDLGDVEVTLTVTDGSGNTSSCTTVITIEDGENFMAVCQDITIFLDANGMASIDPEDIDNGSGGGCNTGPLEFELSQEDFDCNDTGPNIVTLVVTDGNDTDSCTATVTVIDNMPPSIMCPANVTVDCGTDISDPTDFGMATANDNCGGVTIEEMSVADIDECGAGTLTRTFTATDNSDNTATCVQVVTLGASEIFDEGDIDWPDDVSLEECSSTDPEDIPDGEPVINIPNGSCALISVSFSDSTVMTCDPLPNPPCVQIFRTWTVIDSCQLEGGTDNGIFTYVQEVDVDDNTGPIFGMVADITVEADPETCLGDVTLMVSATSCGDPVDVTNDFNDGGGDASGIYPVGTTVVTFTAEDECCNISTLEVTVTVVDAGDPEFTCFKPIVCIPAEQTLTFAAGDFIIFENPDGCLLMSDFFFSYSNDDPFDSLDTWSCADAGDVVLVEIFIYDSQLSLIDSCFGDLDINDGPPDCPTTECSNPNLTLQGLIFTEDGAELAQIPVGISDASMPMTYTSISGRYGFNNLVQGNNYVVKPQKDDDPLEGVSTLDLVAIQKHLLGLKPLDSPYKKIAADVVSSGKITALDLLELRKMLLGVQDNFSNNTSWRFVEAHFEFPDPFNPFMIPFPEEMVITEMYDDMLDADFIGIKIGDVNNTVSNVQRPELGTTSGRSVVIVLHDADVAEGEEFVLPVSYVEFDNIVGYQYALRFDPAKLEFNGISIPAGSHLVLENFGTMNARQGEILVSWNAGKGMDISEKDIVFGLQFTSKVNTTTGKLISIDHQNLHSEAYIDGDIEEVVSMEVHTVDKNVTVDEQQLTLMQNSPNPFAEATEIPFYLPEAGTVEILVHSFDGKLVYASKEDMAKGINRVRIYNSDLPSAGVYFYTVMTDTFRATRKMTLLD